MLPLVWQRKLREQPLLLGLGLTFILPPIGIGWLVIWSVRLMINRWPLSRPHFNHPLGWLMIVLTTTTLLNGLVRPSGGALLTLAALIFCMILLTALQTTLPGTNLSDLVTVLIAGGVYIALMGGFFQILNSSVHFPLWFNFLTGNLLFGYRSNQTRLYGPTYNPNDACFLLLIALALILARLVPLIRQRHQPRLNQLAFLAFIECVGIYQTQSRTGILVMLGLLGLLVAFVSLPWLWRTLLVSIPSSSVLLAILPRTTSAAAATTGRFAIWTNSWHLLTEFPLFGVTYFGFPQAYTTLTGSTVPHAHNLFLMMFTAFGLIGGIAFIGVVLLCGYLLARQWFTQHRHFPDLRYFVFALPIIIEYGCTDFVLASLQVLIIVLVLLTFWQQTLYRRFVTPA